MGELDMENGSDGQRGERISLFARIGNAAAWLAAALGAIMLDSALCRAVFLAVLAVFRTQVEAIPAGQMITGTPLVALMAAAGVTEAVVFVGWWLYLRPRSFLMRRSNRFDMRRAVFAAGALALLGVGLQMAISLLLSWILPLFPSYSAEYSELMGSEYFSNTELLSMTAVSVLAPIAEEALFRGVVFELSLRAVCPEARSLWRRRPSHDELSEESHDTHPALPSFSVSAPRFWCANAIQALLFGVLHGNVVQGAYAFALGLVFGWIDWRAGKLWCGIFLHFAVNLSLYFVANLAVIYRVWGTLGYVICIATLLACGFELFFRVTTRRGSTSA